MQPSKTKSGNKKTKSVGDRPEPCGTPQQGKSSHWSLINRLFHQPEPTTWERERKREGGIKLGRRRRRRRESVESERVEELRFDPLRRLVAALCNAGRSRWRRRQWSRRVSCWGCLFVAAAVWSGEFLAVQCIVAKHSPVTKPWLWKL